MNSSSSNNPASTIISDNTNLVMDTAAFWEKRLGRSVSHEEARVMIENVTGYFSLLARWDAASAETGSNIKEQLSTNNKAASAE